MVKENSNCEDKRGTQEEKVSTQVPGRIRKLGELVEIERAVRCVRKSISREVRHVEEGSAVQVSSVV